MARTYCTDAQMIAKLPGGALPTSMDTANERATYIAQGSALVDDKTPKSFAYGTYDGASQKFPNVPRPFWGLSYYGTDYCTMTNAEADGAFDFGLASFTMQCWVKVDDFSSNSNIIQSRLGTDFWQVALSFNVSGNFYFALVDTDAPTGPGVGTITVDDTTVRTAGTWYHVAGVVDRSADEAYLYVNGVKVATEDITDLLTMTIPANTMYLGSNTTTQFMIGEMAWVSISKGAAVTDFSDRFTQYATGNGRTSAWMFQPGSGQVATPYIGSPDWTIGASSSSTATDPSWSVSPYTDITTAGPTQSTAAATPTSIQQCAAMEGAALIMDDIGYSSGITGAMGDVLRESAKVIYYDPIREGEMDIRDSDGTSFGPSITTQISSNTENTAAPISNGQYGNDGNLISDYAGTMDSLGCP